MYEIASLATDSRAVYPSQGGLPLESKALDQTPGEERMIPVLNGALILGSIALIFEPFVLGLGSGLVLSLGVPFILGGLGITAMDEGASRDLIEARRSKRIRALCRDLGKHYGLKLSWSERHRLADTDGARSAEGELRVFGSITRSLTVSNGELKKQTIYLIWADGRLQLAESQDGERFSELRRPFPSDPHELRSVCGEEKPL